MRLTAAVSLVGLSASTQRWMPEIMEETSTGSVVMVARLGSGFRGSTISAAVQTAFRLALVPAQALGHAHNFQT